MSVTFKKETYENYGNCLTISNGRLVMKVTLDVGPRVIYASLDNDANIFFNDLPRAEKREGEEMDKVFGKGATWYIYGGTRMWFSPEEMPLSYYPDNDPVKYEINGNSVSFTPPVQKITCMQQTITITMDPDRPAAKIDYSAKNMGSEKRNYALWALSVCDRDGMAILPQPNDKTGLLANRVLAVWEYTDMSDTRRLMLGKNSVAVRQLSDEDITPLKIGMNNTAGKVGYVHGNTLFVKSYSPDHQNGEYPDYGVSTEVYTSKKFIEVETLSKMHEYLPGDSFTHTENWEFFADVKVPAMEQAEIDKITQKYLA